MKIKAFTLIEILLSLMIISILAVPVAVTLYRHVKVASEETVKGQISYLADNAKLLSCSYGVPVAMAFGREENTISLIVPNSPNVPVRKESVPDVINIMTSYTSPSSVKIGKIANGSTSFVPDIVQFYPNGTSDRASVQIIVGDKVVNYLICPYTGIVSEESEGLYSRMIDLDELGLSVDDVFK